MYLEVAAEVQPASFLMRTFLKRTKLHTQLSRTLLLCPPLATPHFFPASKSRFCRQRRGVNRTHTHWKHCCCSIVVSAAMGAITKHQIKKMNRRPQTGQASKKASIKAAKMKSKAVGQHEVLAKAASVNTKV